MLATIIKSPQATAATISISHATVPDTKIPKSTFFPLPLPPQNAKILSMNQKIALLKVKGFNRD